MKIEEIIEIGIGGRTTIWKKVKNGEFPKPIKLGGAPSSPIRWRSTDIDEYLRNLGS